MAVETAAQVVGSLVADIEGETDVLVPRIGERIREEIPDFRRLPADALARAIRGNVTRALTALRDLRPPTDAELEQAAAIGRERAEQGLTVDAVLHGYRISVSAVWSRFGELARERGADVTSVLAFSETLWLAADAGLVTALDHDLIGIAARRPGPIAGVAAGVGPPAGLDGLPSAYALAGRALQTALAFGQEGV